MDENLVEKFFWLCRERYEVKLKRDRGEPFPWTSDALLQRYHFCNVFRRDDRVSRLLFAALRKEKPAEQLRKAIVGRAVNSARSLPALLRLVPVPPVSTVERILREQGMNTVAYRLNTARGLNNRTGVAEQVVHAGVVRDLLSDVLRRVSTGARALQLLEQYAGVPRFVCYQVYLDLLEVHWWGRVRFPDAHAVVMGPGALRAAARLRGEAVPTTWTQTGWAVGGGPHGVPAGGAGAAVRETLAPRVPAAGGARRGVHALRVRQV